MELLNSLKDIINEQVAINAVHDSIRNKDVIILYYDGDEPGGRGLRKIEPVCLGRSKSDNLVLRAWDIEGASHRDYIGEKPLPGWRLFRVDKIKTYKKTGEKFNTPRENYNFNGDKTMKSIIINAKFD